MEAVSAIHSAGAVQMDKALQAEQDIRKMQSRENEMDMMAKRVISKFNNNSERILNIMNKQ